MRPPAGIKQIVWVQRRLDPTHHVQLHGRLLTSHTVQQVLAHTVFGAHRAAHAPQQLVDGVGDRGSQIGIHSAAPLEVGHDVEVQVAVAQMAE